MYRIYLGVFYSLENSQQIINFARRLELTKKDIEMQMKQIGLSPSKKAMREVIEANLVQPKFKGLNYGFELDGIVIGPLVKKLDERDRFDAMRLGGDSFKKKVMQMKKDFKMIGLKSGAIAEMPLLFFKE